MDIVITFVDGNDPLWQQDYAQTVGPSALAKRYRDWGLLKYLFRGIEKHLPFIRQVHLVVSRESQVPAWIDPQNVHIVLHRDIIPQQFLPVFNSNAREMFLHRIPGLDEEFLYFNDDMFPVADSKKEDFFENGKISIGFAPHIFVGSSYKRFCKNSDRLVRETIGKPRYLLFRRPQHICTPLLKSACEELYSAAENKILSSVTALRQPNNYSQYIYSDYLFYTKRSTGKRISKKHFSLAAYSAQKIAAWLENPNAKFACINDVTMSDEQFSSSRPLLIEAFEKRYPEKSRFEK